MTMLGILKGMFTALGEGIQIDRLLFEKNNLDSA